jgi:16S rRNA (uracil1498-N3)-methyltransferase
VSKVRVPLAAAAPGTRTLEPSTSRYLCRVLRLPVGAAIVVFDATARMEADATIELASAEAAEIRIGELRAAEVTARAELVLVYGLAKGDKIDAVVRDATELGATAIVVARTERTVVQLDEARAAARRERWQRIAEQAARQCGRADPPAIVGAFEWSDALACAASCSARYCLDPAAKTRLGAELPGAVASGASIAFAVGPEGGLTPAEIEGAADRGFTPVSLGRFVLRTETVAAAVLGAVRVLEIQ